MNKAEIINIELKKESQMRHEMNLTPQQRILLVFQLMDLAIAMSPNIKNRPIHEDDIPWIELRLKNDLT